ncbi:MAG: UDP-N-acetylmuramoyl-tripeptide--D-alanyl-D-alanine ligase [Planctomycetota bacterium]
MLDLTVGSVAQALGARVQEGAEQPVRRVVMDSRAVVPGDLFVALVGARTDGHVHLRQALAQGAVAALVQPDRGERPDGLPCLVVPDTLKALGALARFHLGRLQAQVVGITGSVGKTTAKDFLFQLLGGAAAKAFAAPASYNSEVGLPLAILGAPLDTKVLVLEYGINAPGEMDVLLSIARPHHAWITAIGASHLEGLGTIATVASEKGKLAAAVGEFGHAWMPTEIASVMQESSAQWQADVRLRDPLHDPSITMHSATPGAWEFTHARWGRLQLHLHAAHEIVGALMAADIAATLGVADAEIAKRLPHLTPPGGRLTVTERNGLVILDDAYNANPLSMKAALQVLAQWPTAGRRIAVLGSMKELGPSAEELHRQVGVWLLESGCTELIGVGSGGAWIASGAADAVSCRVVDDARAAAEILQQRLQDGSLEAGDVLLLKASRAEALERILRHLPQELDPEHAEVQA